MSGFVTLDDPNELRQHLDDLNNAGVHPVAVGLDTFGQPFLIALVGPYAEREDVFFDSPWQRETVYNVPARCNDCDAHAHRMEDLRFPVIVVIP